MNNPFDITGQVVVITGGSGFLGTQYTNALTAAGAIVENFDIATGVDVTDEASVEKAVHAVLKKHGKIDGLILNAAANPKPDGNTEESPWAPYSEFSTELFRKELDLNLTGSFIVAKVVSRSMMAANKGSIIFIGSDLALIGPTNSLYEEGKFKDIAYGASKAGVLGLMRFFAAYLGSHGVRVNTLILGGVEQSTFDPEFVKRYGRLSMLGRMAKAGEYNGAVQFLLSDTSSYMTSATLVIDGGKTAW